MEPELSRSSSTISKHTEYKIGDHDTVIDNIHGRIFSMFQVYGGYFYWHTDTEYKIDDDDTVIDTIHCRIFWMFQLSLWGILLLTHRFKAFTMGDI